jgi:hypothetical protein
MATLSIYALESMGFRRLEVGESVSASFHSLHTYELQGIKLNGNDDVVRSHGISSGVPYEVAIGISVNALTRSIMNDDLAEDEEEWQKIHKCQPPFVLIHIGPTKEHAMTGEFIKFEGPTITTYESFIPARVELQEMEAAVIPNVVSALTCSLGLARSHLKLRKLSSDAFGITSSGMVLYDFRIEMRASLYASDQLELTEVNAKLQYANDLVEAINPKVSKFFFLALEEEDPLKRFLYFFLAIERQTHFVFSSVDHDRYLSDLIQSPERIRESSTIFFQKQREHWKSLQDRFVWCALSIWTHLSDDDIETFKRLKKVRDKIAHGEITEPPDDAVVEIERLIIKLQNLSGLSDIAE